MLLQSWLKVISARLGCRLPGLPLKKVERLVGVPGSLLSQISLPQDKHTQGSQRWPMGSWLLDHEEGVLPPVHTVLPSSAESCRVRGRLPPPAGLGQACPGHHTFYQSIWEARRGWHRAAGCLCLWEMDSTVGTVGWELTCLSPEPGVVQEVLVAEPCLQWWPSRTGRPFSTPLSADPGAASEASGP